MRKEIKGFIAILFVATSVVSTVFFVVPAQAERTTITIDWTRLYLTRSYDIDDDSKFYLQIKYKDRSGWHVAESGKVKISEIKENMYYPATSFTIANIMVNEYIYVRMMEWDFWSRDDQICKEYMKNSKTRIYHGSWDISVYLAMGFTAYSVGEGNSTNKFGTWFYIDIRNLG